MSSLTQCLRVELGMLGIDVVEMVTGAVRSEFYETLKRDGGSGLLLPKLPERSLWGKDERVKEAVEKSMTAEKLIPGFEQDRGKWAGQVLWDLEKGKVSSITGVGGWCEMCCAVLCCAVLTGLIEDDLPWCEY